jgi:hypothetical protein
MVHGCHTKDSQKKKTPIYQFPLLVSEVPAISSPHVCAVPVSYSFIGGVAKKKEKKKELNLDI